jgi:SAM-dependent methyltransferase
MQKTIINLGGGSESILHPEWLNLDVVAAAGVDVVHNVMDFPWPFDDESASEVRASDLLEHLPTHTRDYESTYIKFIEEAYRVLEPSGVLIIQTPRFDSPNLPIDLGHVKGFHERSMDYFDETTDLGKAYGYYSKARFSVSSEVTANLNVIFTMVKVDRA